MQTSVFAGLYAFVSGKPKESTERLFEINFRNALKWASLRFSMLMTYYPKGGLECEVFPQII